jgi:hypothetical protein
VGRVLNMPSPRSKKPRSTVDASSGVSSKKTPLKQPKDHMADVDVVIAAFVAAGFTKRPAYHEMVEYYVKLHPFDMNVITNAATVIMLGREPLSPDTLQRACKRIEEDRMKTTVTFEIDPATEAQEQKRLLNYNQAFDALNWVAEELRSKCKYHSGTEEEIKKLEEFREEFTRYCFDLNINPMDD